MTVSLSTNFEANFVTYAIKPALTLKHIGLRWKCQDNNLSTIIERKHNIERSERRFETLRGTFNVLILMMSFSRLAV